MKQFSDTLQPLIGSPAPMRESMDRSSVRAPILFQHSEVAAQLPIPLRTLRRDVQYIWQSLRTSAPLWLADQLALVCSLLFASWIGVAVNSTFTPSLLDLATPLVVTFTLANLIVGLYPGIGLSPANELRLTTIASTLMYCVFLIATAMQSSWHHDTVIALVCSYLGSLLCLPVFRNWARSLASNFRWWQQPALVFGDEEEGARAFQALLDHPQLGLRPVGLLDDVHHHWFNTSDDPKWYLGQLNEARQLAESRGVFWGIVAMSHRTSEDVASVIDRISTTVPNLLILPDFAKAGRGWDGAHDCGDSLGARCTEMLLLPVPRVIKRTMDLILATAIILLLLPLMAVIAVAIRLSSPGEILYRQTVLGIGGRRFCMWKFRSMHVDGNAILEQWLITNPELQDEWDRHHKLRNDPRVTAIGHFLRRFSLDELPQLFNVLRGDMSLIGPRPYPLYECDEMQSKAPLVLRIRPGITGLWQVSGRSNMTFEQRLLIDMKYVRNWSVWIDMAILAKTVVVVVRKTGAY